MKRINFIILIFFILTACKKTNEKLIIGSWKIEKHEYSYDGVIFDDIENSCSTDDIWTFTKDGMVEVNQGLTCAGSSTPETTWSLKDNDQTIVYTYDNALGEYYSIIMQLDKKTLVTEFFTGDIENGKVRNTFSKY